MYEFPRQGLARKERRALEAAIRTIREELSSISRLQRHDLLRAAVGSGSTLRA
jgi:RNA polymerase-interacting CarD/CdnL/TRCF family regulator